MKSYEKGFTLIELMVAIGVISIIAVAVIPGILKQIPNISLKNAACSIVSDLRLARSYAIKRQEFISVNFSRIGNSYQIISYGRDGCSGGGDDLILKTVEMSKYRGGIVYGTGDAETDATNAGNSIGASFDPISFYPDRALFSANGIRSATGGYVYITNTDKVICYAIGVPTVAGVVKIKKNSGGDTWTIL